jgi:peptidyl-prolyl cis-trans isomerase D
MLQWLRKASKSWLIAVAIGAIVVVFIFWGVGSYKSARSQQAAEVNGTTIPMAAFARQYNNLVRQYQEQAKGELTPEMIKGLHLKAMALSKLVEETLILQAAPRLGLEVTDAELRRHIESYPAFQKNGRFDEKRYFWVLSRSHLSPQDFEASERQHLLLRKVIAEVTSLAKVSNAELEQIFRFSTEAVDVNYLTLSPQKYLAQENPSDEAVARYYKDNGASFRLPDRVRVKYLLFSAKDYQKKVKLEPGEVKDFLGAHQDEYSQPKVIRARQILISLPAKATEAQQQQAAEKAAALARQIKEGARFATLARADSQDAATKDKGGELGLVQRGQHPPEWDKVAFALKPGSVGLAATPTGIYLIKVEEIQSTELVPDAAKQVEQRLTTEKARELAKDAAEKAKIDLTRSSMAVVAQKLGVTPKETPLFALTDAVPGLGVVAVFNETALHLKPQQVSKVVELPTGFAVLQGVEFQAAHLPALAEIKGQVKEALQKSLARKKAEAEATRLLGELKGGKPLDQVAAAAGLKVQDSAFFTRLQGFRQQKQAQALGGAAFQLSKQHPYPAKPLWWQDNYYLLAFKARREPDPQEFQKARSALRNQFLQQKQELIFASWLDGERRRAKIQVFIEE